MKKLVQFALLLLPLSAVFAQNLSPRARVDGYYFDQADFVTTEDISQGGVGVGTNSFFTRTSDLSLFEGVVSIVGTKARLDYNNVDTIDGNNLDVRLPFAIYPNMYSPNYKTAGYQAATPPSTEADGFEGTEFKTIVNGGTYAGVDLSDPTNQFVTVEIQSEKRLNFSEIAITYGQPLLMGWGALTQEFWTVFQPSASSPFLGTVGGASFDILYPGQADYDHRDSVSGPLGTRFFLRYKGADYNTQKPVIDVNKLDGQFHKYTVDLKPLVAAQLAMGNTVPGVLLKNVLTTWLTFYNESNNNGADSNSTGIFKMKNYRVGYYAAPPVTKLSNSTGAPIKADTTWNFSGSAKSSAIYIATKARVVTAAITGSGASAFKVNSSSPILTGSTSTRTITFTPTVAGVFSAVYALKTNEDEIVKSITLTGSAVAPTAPVVGWAGNMLAVTNTVSGVSYQWWKNGATVTGANSSWYTVTALGVYQVSATSSDFGLVAVSNVVTVAGPAVPTITATQSGAVYTLSVASVTGVTYQWWTGTTTGPLATITGATGSSYSTTVAGTYYVQATYFGASAVSAGFPVTVTSLAFNDGVSYSVFPTVLSAGSSLNIVGVDGGSAVITSVLGASSAPVALTGEPIAVPSSAGIYFVRISDKSGNSTVVKIVVQ